MISNRLFSKTMRLDYRREFPWTILYLLILLFVMPVTYLFGLQNLTTRWEWQEAAGLAARQQLLFNHAFETVCITGPAVVLTLFAALEAYHSFGYLHRKTELDFYHSLPQTRRQLFFGHYTNGVRTVLVPYFLAAVTGILCAVLSGVPAGMFLRAAVTACFVQMLGFLLTYTVCVLAIMLTGRALTGILGMGVLAAYFPGIATLINALPRLWFRTFVNDDGWLPGLRLLAEFSPVSQFVQYVQVVSERFKLPADYHAVSTGFIFRILAGFAVLCALLILNVWLYEKRPLEKTGEGMVFSGTERPIRILLTLSAGTAMIVFMKSLDRSAGWVIFFTLAAVVLGHMLIELIYRADFRKVFGHPAECGATCAVMIALTLCLQFDVTGYNRYLPDPGEAEAVRISMEDGGELGRLFAADGNTGGIGTAVVAWYGAYGEDAFTAYGENGASDRSEENTGFVTDQNTIEAVRRIAGYGIENARKMDAREHSFNLFTAYEGEQAAWEGQRIVITWKLSGGKERSRCYCVPAETMRKEYAVLFDSEEYRAWTWPLLTLDPDRDISVLTYCDLLKTASFDEAESRELLDAYLMDIRAMTFEEIGDSCPKAMLRIFLTPEALADAGIDIYTDYPQFVHGRNRSDTEFDRILFLNYPVFESFENTVRVLEAHGFRLGYVTVPESMGISFEAFTNDEVTGAEFEKSGILQSEEDVLFVLNNCYPYEYMRYNLYGKKEFGLLCFYLKEGMAEIPLYPAAGPEMEALYERIMAEPGE